MLMVHTREKRKMIIQQNEFIDETIETPCPARGRRRGRCVGFFPRAALDFLAYPRLSSFTSIGVFEWGD
jgi:hypothetical protein